MTPLTEEPLKTMLPLAFLGGTFDPVHRGHLALAKAALDELRLARVEFLPAPSPWQKKDVTGVDLRLEMLRAAIQYEPHFGLDTTELTLGAPTYAIRTVEVLRERYGPERSLVWILGDDQWARFDTWVEWQRILNYVHIAVANRIDAVPVDADLRGFEKLHSGMVEDIHVRPHGSVVHFRMPRSPESSTEIREAYRRGDPASVAAWLKTSTREFIASHGLYTGE